MEESPDSPMFPFPPENSAWVLKKNMIVTVMEKLTHDLY